MTHLTWEDDFTGASLSEAWTDAYLPAWSSRAKARADYAIFDSCLRLSIPLLHPVWCEGVHVPPIRVSGIQSGNFSGPVGSMRGQQPFADGLRVREQQVEHWGWVPMGGTIEIRARMELTGRSMASAWFIGREVDPLESAEICVFEIFGKDIHHNEAHVGMGVHAFRDPEAAENFEQPAVQIDPAAWHTYAIDWSPERVTWSVDGVTIRTSANPPWYPMQLELAVFDFPEWSNGEDGQHEPYFDIDWIRQRAE